MEYFQDIESEYLRIEPLDSAKLASFYAKHKTFFESLASVDKEIQIKGLEMLTEIAYAFSFAHRHREALTLIRKIRSRYAPILAEISPDQLNQLNFCSANSNLALGKYRAALTTFKAYIPSGQDQPQVELLIKLCRDKIFNRRMLVAATLGMFVLIVKYTILWSFPEYYSPILMYLGWFGAFAILGSGLFARSTSKQNSLSVLRLHDKKTSGSDTSYSDKL